MVAGVATPAQTEAQQRKKPAHLSMNGPSLGSQFKALKSPCVGVNQSVILAV